MTLDQAVAVLKEAQGTRCYAYLVTSIVTGARTEEISLQVGHDGTDTTERVYCHQLRPVRRSAA